MLWGNSYPHGAYSSWEMKRNTSSTWLSERSAMKNVVPKCRLLYGRTNHFNEGSRKAFNYKVTFKPSLKDRVEFEAKGCSLGILGHENNVKKGEKM